MTDPISDLDRRIDLCDKDKSFNRRQVLGEWVLQNLGTIRKALEAQQSKPQPIREGKTRTNVKQHDGSYKRPAPPPPPAKRVITHDGPFSSDRNG
jgi:hypothetical protein